MGTEQDERIDLKGDGRIILYKREGLKRPKWQTRIRVPNSTGYKIVTTGTDVLRDAERFAENLYEELYMRVKAGGSVQSRTFKQVYEEWKKHVTTMGHTRRGGSWGATIARIESYALKFFGGYRINAIGEKEFTEFWAWRKANFSKMQPSNGTLRRERTCILPVFKYAVSKGYITKIPETNPPKPSGERRPTFSPREWKAIRNSTIEWVKEGKKLATWRDRYVAQHCFNILAYTGIRIGELRTLRWSDVWSVKGADGAYYAGSARGKTGARDFVFQPGSEVSVKLLYSLRCRELKEQNPDLEDPRPHIDSLVVCHPDGRPIGSMKHSFESLLNFAGIPQKKDGANRTIYSLRHLYATRQLSKEISPFLLAKQMGTSVDMLERHYGQTVTTTLAEQITKAKPAQIEMRGGDFPF
jgi:integrase